MNFDLRSRSWPDSNRSCCTSLDPYWQRKRNGTVLKPLSHLYQKLLAKNKWWPLVTAYGHSWPFEDSPRVFWISNLIYDTNSHNAARTLEFLKTFFQRNGVPIQHVNSYLRQFLDRQYLSQYLSFVIWGTKTWQVLHFTYLGQESGLWKTEERYNCSTCKIIPFSQP